MYHDRPIVVDVQQQTVLRHLLLHQQHLLRAAHDEVAARVVEALLHLGQLRRTHLEEWSMMGSCPMRRLRFIMILSPSVYLMSTKMGAE